MCKLTHITRDQCIIKLPVQLAASAACSAARAAFWAARAAPRALHTRRCGMPTPPPRQSACEHAVPQYHTARHALQSRR